MAPPRRKPLSVAHQVWGLRSRFPAAQPPVVHVGRLSWVVQLQPTPLSVNYTVRLEYDQRDDRPKMTVLDPPLERRAAEPLPHVYEGDELCLFYDEFDGGKDLIADTVVPWVSEWLYHYELWQLTGDWHGGGIHPEDAPPLSRGARRRRERSRHQ